MKSEEIIALLKKEEKNANKALAKAKKVEENWDYSDVSFTIERAYSEGYAEAIASLLEEIEAKKKKKKEKK